MIDINLVGCMYNAALESFRTYDKKSSITHKTEFISSFYVVRITDTVVIKVKPYTSVDFLKSQRDAVLTKFLIEKKVPVVSFCEDLPCVPVRHGDYIIAFRKYIEGVPKVLTDKNIGAFAAHMHNVHSAFSLFDIEEYKWLSFLDKTKNISFNIPDGFEVGSVTCKKCEDALHSIQPIRTMLQKMFQLLQAAGKLKRQIIHMDYQLKNTIQDKDDNLFILDFDQSCISLIEYDIAHFLINCNDKQKHTFIEYYTASGGICDNNIVKIYSQILHSRNIVNLCPLRCMEKAKEAAEKYVARKSSRPARPLSLL